jgi:DNA-binding transcriptional ArsR family regulator
MLPASSREDRSGNSTAVKQEANCRTFDRSFTPMASCFRNCENMISISAVEEINYRQSRLCRLLGNPVAFTVVSLLADSKEMSTGEIARAIGRSVPRISNILGALRLAELVRYETEGRHARYRLKHPREVRRILDALSGFVKTTSVGQG